MGTRIIWVIPAFCQISEHKSLEFDLTEHAIKLLKNKVWERPFQYGFLPTLEKLSPQNILQASIRILPSDYDFTNVSDHSVQKYVRAFCRVDHVDWEKTIQKAQLTASRNLIVITADFGFESAVPKVSERPTVEFAEICDRGMAIIEELGALFRAAIHLTFASDYAIMPSLAKNPIYGGLTAIESQGNTYLWVKNTSDFTFPSVFLSDHTMDFTHMLDTLSDIWHLPLWPIHRFLRALNTEYVEMENFLDLLFALEGLFEEKISSDMVRFSTTLLISKSRKEALKINEVLKHTFKMRNDIVHGGEYYTGMEKIKIGGKQKISQAIFWELRRIVAKTIHIALEKHVRTPEMKYLRINVNDLINHSFK